MKAREFIAAMAEARRHFTVEQWARLISVFESRGGEEGEIDVGEVLPDVLGGDAIWLMNRGLRQRGAFSWGQVSAVMATLHICGGQNGPIVTPVWTGPANGSFPVRRFDQVLYDLVSRAQRRILIVTFAAYRVGHLCELLLAAMARGAKLTLVLEGEASSGGQLSHDALNAFRSIMDAGCEIYSWPLENREKNAAGRPGKLHVKCAVADDTALVGSGNLTEDAFNRNMELGLVVRGQATADAVYDHFAALIVQNELARMNVT